MRQALISYLLFLFLASQAWAAAISERVISSGANAGKKLIDVVTSYTTFSQNGDLVQIPENAIHDAFEFFDKYQNTTRTYQFMAVQPVASKPQYSEFKNLILQTTGPTIANKNIMVIFDLNLPRSAARLHIINLNTGEVESIEASHGRESECKNRPLFACTFISNRDSSATPLGFFSTGRSYYGEKHGGISITMDGLEQGSPRRLPGGNNIPSTIIIHSADYVRPGFAGRSHGCISLSLSNMNRFDGDLAGGALFYFYHSSLDSSPDAPVVSGLQ